MTLTVGGDWQLDANHQIAGLPGTNPVAQRFLTVNGQRRFARSVQRNQRLRLRLISSVPHRIMTVSARGGLDGWVMALDGMPLAQPQRLGGAVRMTPPAQRIDLFVDVTASEGTQAQLVGAGEVLAAFPVSGAAAGGGGDLRPLYCRQIRPKILIWQGGQSA